MEYLVELSYYFNSCYAAIADWFHALYADFVNQRKRVFIGYLAISVIIAFIFLKVVEGQTSCHAVNKIFDKRILWSKSAKADYKIFAINRAFLLLLSPYLLSQTAVITFVFFTLGEQHIMGFHALTDWNPFLITVLYTVVYFLSDDFSKFVIHRMMHKSKVLWSFHKVHHSAQTMTPITVYRVHPVESLIYGIRGTIVTGAVIGLFAFCFGTDSLSIISIIGVNIFTFLFNIAGSNLRHSHIRLTYWTWIERVIISPAQHQLHHSRAQKHFDKNFGAMLAIWDWAFGSLHISEKNAPLTFGLQPDEMPSSGLKHLYLKPLFEASAIITKGIITNRRR